MEYKKGDLVYVDGTNIWTERPAKKLDDKRFGPFPVIGKVGSAAYKLELPASWKRKYLVFHESLLTLFRPPTFPSQQKPPPPPPVVINNEEQFEVEEILDSRKRGKGIQYLVKWSGYSIEEATWQSPADVERARDLVIKFHDKHPTAPQITYKVKYSPRLRKQK